MDPITLTIRDVLTNAFAKWDQLGVFTGKDHCKYRYEDGSCCVIGASFDDAAAQAFDKMNPGYGQTITWLIDQGHVCVVTEEEAFALGNLQRHHDFACSSLDPDSRSYNTDKFKLAMKVLAEKYGVEIPEGIEL